MTNDVKVTASTVARTIILALALVNQVLSVTGHAVLPISDEQVEQIVSLCFTIVAAVVAWWKNNSFTSAAKTADLVMKSIKAGDTTEEEATEDVQTDSEE